MDLYLSSSAVNVGWPNFLLIGGILAAFTFVAGLILEWIFVKLLIRQKWMRSLWVVSCMNFVSALVGIFLLPLTTIVLGAHLTPGEPPSDFAFIGGSALAIPVNVGIEGIVLKRMSSVKRWSQIIRWLLPANILSTGVTVIVLWCDYL